MAGEQWPGFLKALRPGGCYAISGAIGSAMVDLDVRTLYLKNLSLLGCTALEPEAFSNLIAIVESGDIVPVVAATYPLERIADAERDFQTKSHVGKLALMVRWLSA